MTSTANTVEALNRVCKTTRWPLVKFGEILRPNKRPYMLGSEEDANLVGMRLYGHGPFHRELKSASNIRKKSHFVIKAGDVIYNKLFAWKGTFGVVPPELDGMFVSDKFPTYEHDGAKVHLDYLNWFFRYPPLWEQARQMSTGSAALSKLTLNPPRFLDLQIPLPPLEEQQWLARKIGQLTASIEEAKSLRYLSDIEAAALLKSRLNVLGHDFHELGELADALTGKPRNGWSARCDNAEDGTPVLALSAVTGYSYDPTAFKRTSLPTDKDAHYWLRAGDLLITRSNTPELVGHAAIYDGEPKRCIYPDLIMRLPVNDRVADTRFIWFWLQTPLVRKYITSHAKGTSPTMKKISQGIVMRIPFPVGITLEEQWRIISYLEVLQVKVNRLMAFQKRTADEIDALLPAILDKAFKGELQPSV